MNIIYISSACENDEIEKVEIEINSIFYLEAPVEEGKILANLKVILNGETIEILEIYNKEEIRKKEIRDYLVEFMELLE